MKLNFFKKTILNFSIFFVILFSLLFLIERVLIFYSTEDKDNYGFTTEFKKNTSDTINMVIGIMNTTLKKKRVFSELLF